MLIVKIRKKKVKKRITPEEDYERAFENFYRHYKTQLNRDKTERGFNKAFKDYFGEDADSELKSEVMKRTEDKLKIKYKEQLVKEIVKRRKEESQRFRRGETRFTEIGYVKGAQVFAREDFVYIKGKQIRIFRDKKGRFVKHGK